MLWEAGKLKKKRERKKGTCTREVQLRFHQSPERWPIRWHWGPHWRLAFPSSQQTKSHAGKCLQRISSPCKDNCLSSVKCMSPGHFSLHRDFKQLSTGPKWLAWLRNLPFKGMKVQGNKYNSQWQATRIEMKYLLDSVSICLSIQKYESL